MKKLATIQLLLLASGCSFYAQSDGERLRDEVFVLKTQITSLQRKLNEAEARESKAKEELSKVSSVVSDLNTSARRNDADLGVILDEVRQDVARMKGQLDLLVERMSEVEGKAEKTSEELELRFQRLAEQEKIREAESAKEKAEAAAATRKQEALLSKPKVALKEAERLIEQGKAAAARKLVRALEISQRGERSWGVYAPKAQYLIGETYFIEEDFQQAAAAFNAVRKKYPKSKTWLPGSILKLGMCFERLGLKNDALLFYRSVSRKYPKHPAGKEGRRLLKKLEG